MKVTTTHISYKDAKTVDVFEGVGEVVFAQSVTWSFLNVATAPVLILNRDTYDSVLIEADPA
jgi:hypothetical protein